MAGWARQNQAGLYSSQQSTPGLSVTWQCACSMGCSPILSGDSGQCCHTHPTMLQWARLAHGGHSCCHSTQPCWIPAGGTVSHTNPSQQHQATCSPTYSDSLLRGLVGLQMTWWQQCHAYYEQGSGCGPTLGGPHDDCCTCVDGSCPCGPWLCCSVVVLSSRCRSSLSGVPYPRGSEGVGGWESGVLWRRVDGGLRQPACCYNGCHGEDWHTTAAPSHCRDLSVTLKHTPTASTQNAHSYSTHHTTPTHPAVALKQQQLHGCKIHSHPLWLTLSELQPFHSWTPWELPVLVSRPSLLFIQAAKKTPAMAVFLHTAMWVDHTMWDYSIWSCQSKDNFKNSVLTHLVVEWKFLE